MMEAAVFRAVNASKASNAAEAQKKIGSRADCATADGVS
mgnify:FL=1